MVCLAFSSRTAHASPLFDLIGDTLASGGRQARSVSGGSAAAYFNPALLVESPTEASVGFMVLAQQLGVTTYARLGSSFDIMDVGIDKAGHADFNRFDHYPIPTATLEVGRIESPRKAALLARPRQRAGSGDVTHTYEVFGLVVKFLDGKLALGVHGVIPNGEFTKLRAFFNDEREQYFSNSLHHELYADRMTALSLALGLGVRLSERLSLGAGATLSLQANVVAPTFVTDAGALDRILIDMNASVNVGITPHFGASYLISDRLRLNATAHAPQRVELGTSFTFLLANGIEQTSGVTFVLDYMPWQLSVGGSFDILHEPTHTLSVAATLVYATWSAYVDRHGAVPTPAYPWSDTLSPSFGLRYRRAGLSTLLDVSYTPTPVPLQTGRTNYVDNDRVSGSLGAEYAFRAFDANMRVGLQGQFHHLVPRGQTKLPTPLSANGQDIAPELVRDELPDDAQVSGEPIASAPGLQTNNPGWPGFASQGYIVGATVYFTLAL